MEKRKNYRRRIPKHIPPLHQFSKIFPILILLAQCAYGMLDAFAGVGQIKEKNGLFVLNLFVWYDSTQTDATDLRNMKHAFDEASDLLYTATHRQMYIGKVRLSSNHAFKDKADIWIHPGSGAASTDKGNPLHNPISGLGLLQRQIHLYQDVHGRVDATRGPGKVRGDVGIVHELGHYLFDLSDEYHRGDQIPNLGCVNDGIDTTACLMDAGTKADNQRFEFCTDTGGSLSTRHRRTNRQGIRSCWEKIIARARRHHGIGFDPPSQITPRADTLEVDWQPLKSQPQAFRYSLCLDNFIAVDSLEWVAVKHATKLFIDLIPSTEQTSLSIFTFEGIVSPTTIVNETGKASLDSAITALEPSGSLISIPSGLRLSLDSFPTDSTLEDSLLKTECIILIVDEERGHSLDQAVIDQFTARSTQVYVVGIGGILSDSLQHLADVTGGVYRSASDHDELQSVLASFYAVINGEGVVHDEATLGSQSSVPIQKTILIDTLTVDATFIMHMSVPQKSIWLKLSSPDGDTIFDQSWTDTPYIYIPVSRDSLQQHGKEFRGEWTLTISGHQGMPFRTQVLARAPEMDFSIFYNDFVLHASLFAGQPLVSANVAGTIIHKDAHIDSLLLCDDGGYRSGDRKRKDGLFGARLIELQKPGSYHVRLEVAGKNMRFVRILERNIFVGADTLFGKIPALKDSDPDTLIAGSFNIIDINGMNFSENAVVELKHDRIWFRNVTRVDATLLKAVVFVGAKAAEIGPGYLTIINPGGEKTTLKRRIVILTKEKEPGMSEILGIGVIAALLLILASLLYFAWNQRVIFGNAGSKTGRLCSNATLVGGSWNELVKTDEISFFRAVLFGAEVSVYGSNPDIVTVQLSIDEEIVLFKKISIAESLNDCNNGVDVVTHKNSSGEIIGKTMSINLIRPYRAKKSIALTVWVGDVLGSPCQEPPAQPDTLPSGVEVIDGILYFSGAKGDGEKVASTPPPPPPLPD